MVLYILLWRIRTFQEPIEDDPTQENSFLWLQSILLFCIQN